MVPPTGPSQSYTPQQQLLQQQEEARKREYAKRASQKPTDKNMPEGTEDLVIGDGVQRYRQMREAERKLDAVTMRKKLEVMDSVNRTAREGRVLRVWVSNTVENQAWQGNGMDDTFDFDNPSATYKVKIEGRIIDEEEAGGNEEGAERGDGGEKEEREKSTEKRHRFSDFFKQITVDFHRDASLQPDNFSQIEWKKPERPMRGAPQAASNTSNEEADFDSITFERKGDENVNVTINLYRDEHPDRYTLSPPLAALLARDEDDRAGVVAGIWDYVKAQGLQEDEETRRIHCDHLLKSVRHSLPIRIPHQRLTHPLSHRSSTQKPYTFPSSLKWCTTTFSPFHPSNSPTQSESTPHSTLPRHNPPSTTSASSFPPRSPLTQKPRSRACRTRPSSRSSRAWTTNSRSLWRASVRRRPSTISS